MKVASQPDRCGETDAWQMTYVEREMKVELCEDRGQAPSGAQDPLQVPDMLFFVCFRGLDPKWVVLSGSASPHPSLIVSHLFCIP